MSDATFKCPEIMELLVDYLDGDLTPEETRHLETHLSLCPPCVSFVESYRQTGEVCREALKKEMPPALENQLLSFLRKECCEDD